MELTIRLVSDILIYTETSLLCKMKFWKCMKFIYINIEHRIKARYPNLGLKIIHTQVLQFQLASK